MEKNSCKHYKAFENRIFNEILYALTREAAEKVLKKSEISQREAYETENVKPLDNFIKFFITDEKNLDASFYCFATSDVQKISFACMETGKEDTLLIFEVNIPAKKCTVIPSLNTYGFHGQTSKIEFAIPRGCIEELREYAKVYMDEERNEIPFPGVGNPSESTLPELLAQRYFPDIAMSTIDDMMDIMADEQNSTDDIYHFRDYYQEEYPDCVITTDGKTISVIFCHLSEKGTIEGEKDICIINPNTNKVTLIPSYSNKFSFKISEECIAQIRNLSSSWKGERFDNPFPFLEVAKNKSKKYTPNIEEDDNIDDIQEDEANNATEYKGSGSYVVIENDIEFDSKSDTELIIDQIRESPSSNEVIIQSAGILFTQWYNNRAIAGLLDACRNLCDFNDHEKQVFDLFVSRITQYKSLSITFYQGNIRIDCGRQKGKNYECQTLGISFSDRELGVTINTGKATFSKWEVPSAFKTYIQQLQSEFETEQKNKKIKL